jgi:hypothetical protein
MYIQATNASTFKNNYYVDNNLLYFVYYFTYSSFQVHYTISKPSPEWEGYEGRISTEMLLETLPPPPSEDNSSDLLICVCGPDPFTHGILR